MTDATGTRAAILEHLWGCGGEGLLSFEEFATADQMERDGLIVLSDFSVTHVRALLTQTGRVERDRNA